MIDGHLYVMPGLDPGIHGVIPVTSSGAWAADSVKRVGRRLPNYVDNRVKPGHDVRSHSIVTDMTYGRMQIGNKAKRAIT